MLHRYISILAMVILAHGAIAQGWTKLKGPHGGTVEDFEYDGASGKLYAIVNNHLFVSTSSGTTWTEIPIEKKYKPLDQLFIFFAGHGTYDQTFGEGFVVTKESMADDAGKTSYLSHNRLRSIINNIQCEHIFLMMDVCFGGTFDEALASARGADDEVYKEQNQNEFIARKLTTKTRRYLTSGGKTYVSDGIPGKHSPFAKNFLEALLSQGGRDGVLTISEIFSHVEKLKIVPRLGDFGDNVPGSDFIFVRR